MQLKIELHPKGNKSKDISQDLLTILDEIPEAEVEIFDYRAIGVAETLLVTIIGTAVGNLISHFVSELISKSKDSNITTIIKFTDVKLIFKIPGDEENLRDYIEDDTDEN